ncbi:MAG: hypothetical protein KF789_00835 [Bdellovibrionaceae bacterium]|nr:hypothetical protein [Pseudobdellovibrionaceae bacterium]
MLPSLLRTALPCAILLLASAAPAKTKTTANTKAHPAAKHAQPAKTVADKKAKATKPAKKAKKTASRKAGEQWFLSHAEFISLTRAEQKQYLKSVKKVLASLPEKSSTFAKKSTTNPKGRSIASETTLTSERVSLFLRQAELWRGEPPPLYEYTDEARHAEFREKWENSMWWLVTARTSYAKIPDSDPGKAALGKRITELEDFYLGAQKISDTSFAPNDELKTVYTKVEQAKKGEVTVSTPDLIPSGALVDVVTGQKLAWDQPAEKPPEEKPAPATEDPITDLAGQKPAPKDEERLPSLRGYRCMYAGFVIKNDPCRGPQELPEGMSFKGIDSSNLACDDGQILCNPLLFGLKTSCQLTNETPEAEALTCLQSGAPLCVPRGKYATRDCGTRSESEGYLANAAALIRANPEAWKDYLVSFYELCDDKMIVMNEFGQVRDGEAREIPESTLADVEQTCTNAKKQLSKITADYRIETSRPAGSTPAETATPEETEGQQ